MTGIDPERVPAPKNLGRDTKDGHRRLWRLAGVFVLWIVATVIAVGLALLIAESFGLADVWK